MRGLSRGAALGVRLAGVLLAGAGAVRLVQHAAEDGLALALVGVVLLVGGVVFTAPPELFDNEWTPVGTGQAPRPPPKGHGRGAGHGRDAGSAPGLRPTGAMTRAEALAVLDLAEPAGPREALAAYRRAMMAAHPDHGGTAERAARVLAARDVLLGRQPG